LITHLEKSIQLVKTGISDPRTEGFSPTGIYAAPKNNQNRRADTPVRPYFISICRGFVGTGRDLSLRMIGYAGLRFRTGSARRALRLPPALSWL